MTPSRQTRVPEVLDYYLGGPCIVIHNLNVAGCWGRGSEQRVPELCTIGPWGGGGVVEGRWRWGSGAVDTWWRCGGGGCSLSSQRGTLACWGGHITS